jgi:hypothetical protein
MSDIRRYAELKSSQGIQIEIGYVIDYTNVNRVPTYRTSGVTFVIEAADHILPSNASVTIVLINRFYIDGSYLSAQAVTQIPMAHSFTEQGLSAFYGNKMGTSIAWVNPTDIFIIDHPQIAVVVNGGWQQDPMQHGLHNFNFDWQFEWQQH